MHDCGHSENCDSQKFSPHPACCLVGEADQILVQRINARRQNLLLMNNQRSSFCRGGILSKCLKQEDPKAEEAVKELCKNTSWKTILLGFIREKGCGVRTITLAII